MVVDAALKELGLNYEFTIIGNSSIFPDYNVKNPPGLIINGRIVAQGYIPTFEEVIDMILVEKEL